MSGHALGLAGFCTLLLVAVALDLRARTRRESVRAAQALAAAMRTTPGRVAVLAGWLWLGVHFLAR